MRTWVSLFLLVAIISCSQKQEPHKPTIELLSNNPEALLQWYVTNLGLERSTLPNELVASNQYFQIQISSTDKAPDQGRTSGYFKFGFSTNKFDEIYATMQANNVSFRGEPFFDDNLKQRALVSLDMDGNRVQLFEDESSAEPKPYFFSIMAANFESTRDWYIQELGFKEEFNLDLSDRNLNIRLMRNEDWLLELISMPGLSNPTKGAPGIALIPISTTQTQDPEGNQIGRK